MVRNFKTDDLEMVMKVWLETNISAHDFINKGYWQGHYDMVKDSLLNATIFVYEDGTTIQGFIGLMDNYIAGLFVVSACQSKGVGKALLNYVKESNSELSLQVYKKNARAVEFYLREGFTLLREQIDTNTGEAEFAMNWIK